jgi:hypothetical protein
MIGRFTYRQAARGAEHNGVESMVAIASENFKNAQACHTKSRDVDWVEYGDLSGRTQKLDEKMFVFVVSQFDSSSPEMTQYRSRTKEHAELMLYSELILYLFHTKVGSPIFMWSNQQNDLLAIENIIPSDIRTASMSEMREGFAALLDELETNSLKSWQVAVVKLHDSAHAVRTGCKDTVQGLEQNVLNFLANAQDGPEVKTPNVRDWDIRVMDSIEQNKEYHDARYVNEGLQIKNQAPHEIRKQPQETVNYRLKLHVWCQGAGFLTPT